MNDIVTARDPEIIAAEINTIKKQVQQAVIFASIEIGGKLMEAKSMVPQGEWGKWLEQNVEYSQSTAENLMRLYAEYGGNQESLFDTWTNSQAFGKLTYTQHLALLALPFADRQEFAEKNNAESMSTRQLQKAVQDQLEAERKAHQNTQEELESAQALLRDAEQDKLDLQQRLAAAQNVDNSYKDQMDKLKQEKARAEKSETNALAVVKRLETQLKEAENQAKAAKSDLEKARKNPEIPESMMEQLRKEAETEAAEKVAAGLEKQLAAAQNALAAANAKVQATEEKLVAAQKEQKMSDMDLMAVQALAQNLITTANAINGHRMKAVMKDEANAKAIERFLTSVIDELKAAFGLK